MLQVTTFPATSKDEFLGSILPPVAFPVPLASIVFPPPFDGLAVELPKASIESACWTIIFARSDNEGAIGLFAGFSADSSTNA